MNRMKNDGLRLNKVTLKSLNGGRKLASAREGSTVNPYPPMIDGKEGDAPVGGADLEKATSRPYLPVTL